MKESYDIGSPSDPLYGNIWPPPAQVSYGDEFRKAMEGFFGVCYNAELDVLEAISLGLGLRQEGGLKGLHRDGTNELRLTHYPAVRVGEFGCASEGNGKGETGKGNKEAKTRIAAHTDFGSVTLLFQDSVGGLRTFFFLFRTSTYLSSWHSMMANNLHQKKKKQKQQSPRNLPTSSRSNQETRTRSSFW